MTGETPRHDEMPEAKLMRLSYAGKCVGCGAAIDQGERAYYLRADKVVRCLECGPLDQQAPPPAVAGTSADAEAQRSAERAQRLAARQSAAERKAAAFAAGAEGERIVAAALAPLSAAGYLVLHDRAAGPRANLDHLVIGPSGVWLVDAKHWSGTVTTDEKLRHNGRARTNLLEGAAHHRARVAAALAEAKVHAPVQSVFAFTSAAPAEVATVGEVTQVPVGSLRATIGSAPPVLNGRAVDAAVAALVKAFPPAGEAEYPPEVAEDELPDDLREDGAYLFLEPWSRYGKNRLYLHRFGTCFGYVDLADRSCNVESDHERAKPNLEFILEWFADVDAEPRRIGRLGRLAVWAAGGTARRIVGVRFRRQNTDRLYIHVADGTRRTQIGYADLLTGQVHAAEPEFAPIVAKAVAVRARCKSIRQGFS